MITNEIAFWSWSFSDTVKKLLKYTCFDLLFIISILKLNLYKVVLMTPDDIRYIYTN